jgi:hypothetical protein
MGESTTLINPPTPKKKKKKKKTLDAPTTNYRGLGFTWVVSNKIQRAN